MTQLNEDVTDLQGDVILQEGEQNILDDKILQLEIDSNGEFCCISAPLFRLILGFPNDVLQLLCYALKISQCSPKETVWKFQAYIVFSWYGDPDIASQYL